MAMPTYKTKLLEKVALVGDIVSFRWERPAGYDYAAGQWFVITFGAEGHNHHFSHSNSPLDPVLEHTTRMRGSQFKNALDALPPGTEVEIEGPYGSFTLPAEVERAAFLTGGIGITCVRGILRWLAQAQGAGAGQAEAVQDDSVGGRGAAATGEGEGRAVPRPREIVLLFANRSEDAIPFREELEELADGILPLRVVHVLSRPEGDWQGRRGHIDEDLLVEELGAPDGWAFYISGPPSMDESMRELLLGWGAEAGAIRTERFEGYE